MTLLNTTYGWSQGDQVRLLIASGLSIGGYQIEQITVSMNDLGATSIDAVSSVLELIDQFEAAQLKLSELNTESSGRILTKADVLEWEQAKTYNNYSPQLEINRIRTLLYQYMSSCPLYVNNMNGTMLYRS